jgi:hypothetical protein
MVREILEGATVMGKDLEIPKKYKKWMEEVGFVNVEEKLLCWPINVSAIIDLSVHRMCEKVDTAYLQTWPKDPHLKTLGFWFQHDLLKLITAFKPPFLRGLGWTLEEVEKFQVE